MTSIDIISVVCPSVRLVNCLITCPLVVFESHYGMAVFGACRLLNSMPVLGACESLNGSRACSSLGFGSCSVPFPSLGLES